ncbi:MAG TPA: FAD-dependent oxidoreductase, partial [Gaiellaceae bacterium]|nr:FAD-dependent oxidoreductase [Gaiellaceae bacterium]
MSIARVVVVGAGPAGAHAAETLRARGFDGSVVVLGDEPFPPYERPALSKEFLAGSRSRDGLVLRAPGFWESRGIDLRLGTRVARIDYRSRTAVTGRGVAFPWDAIVLATGARARRLPLPAPPSVHVLRGIADAEALRTRLARGVRLAVVGGGFLGAE